MIGRIKGKGGEATLQDDGTWTSPEAATQTYLNALFSVPDDYSPADGPYGVVQLLEAARSLKWKAFVDEKEPLPEGTVY